MKTEIAGILPWRYRTLPDKVAAVERCIEEIYVADAQATLRAEERRKARQVAAMLDEVGHAMSRVSRRVPLLLVDAAAGKAYVGLIAAKLLLEPDRRPASVVSIESDQARVEAARYALPRLGIRLPVECRHGDVAGLSSWPAAPTIVVALHACGAAADAVIDKAVQCSARFLLLVPCCTGGSVSAAMRAGRAAAGLGIAPQAPVRRRFIESFVDSERTWRLEAAGYQTEVVELVPPSLTPHNLLWRSRRVCEPRRMERAATALARFS